MIAAVSFAGYVAIRLLDERRGLSVAAIAGGLASSTATTVSFARLAHEHPQSARLLAGGVLLAGVTMLARVLVLVGLLQPSLLNYVAIPLLAGIAVMLLCAGLLLQARPADHQQPKPQLRNPFELSTVLWLAALITVITLAAKGFVGAHSQAGVLLLAALSGIADVDALTLSMTRLSGAGIDPVAAARAILVAAGVNTASKAVMAAAVGGRQFGTIVGGGSLAALAAMLAAVLLGTKI